MSEAAPLSFGEGLGERTSKADDFWIALNIVSKNINNQCSSLPLLWRGAGGEDF